MTPIINIASVIPPVKRDITEATPRSATGIDLN